MSAKPTVRELEEILSDPREGEVSINPDGSVAVLPPDAVALRAKLTARAKTMLRARDILMFIRDDLEDEGDRVYFGSTNHAEQFKELAEEFDGWAWADIIGDAAKPDYIGDLKRLREEIEGYKALADFAEQVTAMYSLVGEHSVKLIHRLGEVADKATIETLRPELEALRQCVITQSIGLQAGCSTPAPAEKGNEP